MPCAWLFLSLCAQPLSGPHFLSVINDLEPPLKSVLEYFCIIALGAPYFINEVEPLLELLPEYSCILSFAHRVSMGQHIDQQPFCYRGEPNRAELAVESMCIASPPEGFDGSGGSHVT
jgi:hypothetical protein